MRSPYSRIIIRLCSNLGPISNNADGGSGSDCESPLQDAFSFSPVQGKWQDHAAAAAGPRVRRVSHLYGRVTSPMPHCLASGSVAGRQPKPARSVVQPSCCSTRSITCLIGSARLKGQWDRVRRQHLPLHVVATGSSAFHRLRSTVNTDSLRLRRAREPSRRPSRTEIPRTGVTCRGRYSSETKAARRASIFRSRLYVEGCVRSLRSSPRTDCGLMPARILSLWQTQ